MSKIGEFFSHIFHHGQSPAPAAPAPAPAPEQPAAAPPTESVAPPVEAAPPEAARARAMAPQAEAAAPEAAPRAMAMAARRPRQPKENATEISNPQIGTAAPAPKLTAGTLKSPQFLGTEAEYFHEARSILENAKPGDIVCFQMYEFENNATNGDKDSPHQAPGFADQQALLPDLAAAAKRGVMVFGILDASKNKETHDIGNAPITGYLKQNAGDTGKMTVDYYPPQDVNIDHAKQLIHLTPNGDGSFAVQEALVGGSNWGNHTAANDDGGGAFFGRDAVGAAAIFFRDQAFCRGDLTDPALPPQDPNNPVQWTETAPKAEGGGSQSIMDAKLALTKKAAEVYINQFCLTSHDLMAEVVEKGPKAHVRLDPNEFMVNKNAFWEVKKAGGEAMWANTEEHSATMPAQKNHEKLDVYVDDQGQAFALSFGSANDTTNGLNSTFEGTNHSTGKPEEKKTNHESDAVVYRIHDGDYSTESFLDAALAKCKDDLAHHSVENPPQHLSGTAPGQF